MNNGNNHGLADGGTREQFSTGAVRENRNKGRGRFDLVPTEPLRRLALHYERGGVKYAPNNWRKGLPLSSGYDSAMSHLMKFWEGDTTEDHLAAAAWNVFALMEWEEQVKRGRLPSELDDRPSNFDPRVEAAKAAIERMRAPASELAKLPSVYREPPNLERAGNAEAASNSAPHDFPEWALKAAVAAIGKPWEDTPEFFDIAKAAVAHDAELTGKKK